jgi:hypothetical protein
MQGSFTPRFGGEAGKKANCPPLAEDCGCHQGPSARSYFSARRRKLGYFKSGKILLEEREKEAKHTHGPVGSKKSNSAA